MKYWLISGATGVLGKAIAFEWAKSGVNLFLTGTRVDKLAELKEALAKAYPGVYVEFYAADLTNDADRKSLYDYADKFTFSGLICVAGIDNQLPFEEYTEEKLVRQIRLNFEAAASLALFTLNHSEYLRVVNISSVSGEQPLPYFQAYSASKAALTNFSIALDWELKQSGRDRGQVTTVIAGGILTREDVKKYINGEGFWGRKSAKTPEYVAVKCIKAMKRAKRKYIVGTMNRITMAVGKFIPTRLKMRFMGRRLKTSRKNYY